MVVNEKQPIVVAGNYTIHHTKGDATYYISAEVGAKNQPLATTDPAKAVAFDFILKEGTLDTYVIKVHDENQYLAIGANDNNGVRFSSSEFEWTITKGTRDNGSFDLAGNASGTIRYLTLYETTDFRSYNSPAHDNRLENTDLSTVVVKNIDHIEIKQEPTKKQYYVGEAFDPSGLIITAYYTDGSSEDVTEGFTYEGKTGFTAVAESRAVKITYKTKNVYVQGISVIEDQREQTGIEFAEGCDMTKKEYKENESWDATGLAVKDVYSNGDKEDAEGVTYTFNPANPAVGVTSVTVTATKEGFDPVTKVITGISVTELPKNSAEIDTTTFTGLNGNSYSIDTATANDEISYSVSAISKTVNNTPFLQFAADSSAIWTNNSNKLLKSVSVTYTTAQITSASNILSLYGRAEAFDQRPVKADFDGVSAKGTFAPGQETNKITFEKTDNVRNFVILSNSKAAYIASIDVEWYDEKITEVIDLIKLNKTELLIHVGEEEILSKTIKGLGDLGDVSWSSTDESVATVTGGTVSAIGEGNCKIIATSTKDPNIKAECSVVVASARSFTGIKITGEMAKTEYKSNESWDFSGLVINETYSDESLEPITNAELYELSASKTIAEIIGASSDPVTETITITATLKADTTKTATIDVEVEVSKYDPTAAVSYTYTISDYTAGTQYATEDHELDVDNGISLHCENCHFTSELRIYSSDKNNGVAIISSAAKTIKTIQMNVGNKADTLNVYASADGTTYTLVEGLTTTSTYADSKELTLPDGTKYIKLDVAGTNQVRVKSITLGLVG